MARRRDQLTLKVDYMARPPMFYPEKDHNLAIRTPFELHHLPKWSQLNVVRVHHPLHQRRQHFGVGSRLKNRVSDDIIFDMYSTTHLRAHPRTDIWTITYRAMHHPFIFKPEKLDVHSGQKEEALRCNETQEFILYTVYRPPCYYPHFFSSRCIILI